MENIKTYYTEDTTYTFDILEVHEVHTTIWFGKCRENGKYAWLDNIGLQFEGEKHLNASANPILRERDVLYKRELEKVKKDFIEKFMSKLCPFCEYDKWTLAEILNSI